MNESLMDIGATARKLLSDAETTMEDECPGDVSDLRFLGRLFGDHSGMGSVYLDSVKGHGMIILRQPEQRLMSAWKDDYHSFPINLLGRYPYDIREFARYVSACATKMFTRSQVSAGQRFDQLSACGDPNPISEEESNLAITRLREGFIFVGLVEKYEISICLLHAMFGGECTYVEMGESHSNSNSSWYDTSALEGWQDVFDRRLYTEAQTIFNNNLELYGVNDVSCQTCWAQARLASAA